MGVPRVRLHAAEVALDALAPDRDIDAAAAGGVGVADVLGAGAGAARVQRVAAVDADVAHGVGGVAAVHLEHQLGDREVGARHLGVAAVETVHVGVARVLGALERGLKRKKGSKNKLGNKSGKNEREKRAKRLPVRFLSRRKGLPGRRPCSC